MIFFSKKPKPTTLPPGWPSPYHNKCSQRDCSYPNGPQTVKGVYPCRGVPGGFFCEGTYKISSSRAQETERYLKQVSSARRSAEEEQHRKRVTSEMRRPGPAVTSPPPAPPSYITAPPSHTRHRFSIRRSEEEQHRKRVTSEMRGPGPPVIPSPVAPSYIAAPPSHTRPRVDSRRGRDLPSSHYISVPIPVDDKPRYPVYHNPPPPDPSRKRMSTSTGTGSTIHSRRPSRPSDVGSRPPQLPPRSPSFGVPRPTSSQVEAEYITDQIMMHLYPERKIQPRWI